MWKDNVSSETVLPSASPVISFAGPFGEVSLHRAEEVAPFLDHLTVALATLNYSPRDKLGVRVALEEAIVNGLYHGNQGDPTKRVRVRYYAGCDCMLAVVEDEGLGFDPDGVSDPTQPDSRERCGGRGLLLMRHYMTCVRFLGRGNRVFLYKSVCRNAPASDLVPKA